MLSANAFSIPLNFFCSHPLALRRYIIKGLVTSQLDTSQYHEDEDEDVAESEATSLTSEADAEEQHEAEDEETTTGS